MGLSWAWMESEDAPGLALFGLGLLVHLLLARMSPKPDPNPNPKGLPKKPVAEQEDPDIFPKPEPAAPATSPSRALGLGPDAEDKAKGNGEGDAEGEDGQRAVESFPPPPSLGELGAAKLMGLARLSLGLALASQATNLVLHKVLGLQRGTIRGGALKVLRPLKSVLLVPGAGTMVVVGAVTLLAYFRASSLRRSRRNIGGGTIAGLLQAALESLGKDLHEWAQTNEHLRTFSNNDIGWLVASAPPELRRMTPDLTDDFHQCMEALAEETQKTTRGMVQKFFWNIGLARRPKLNRAQLVNVLGVPDISGGWDGVRILLVPGLLTKWYPLYFKSLRYGLERLSFEVEVSRLDTDSSISANAKCLRDEILCIASGGSLDDLGEASAEPRKDSDRPFVFPGGRNSKRYRKVVLYGHSKGATDATACFAMFPEVMEHVAALVSAQGPHGGSWLANDICCTTYQKAAVAMGIERILAGSQDAIFDLAYEKRREYYEAWPEPVWTIVPTICLAACATHQPSALLSPIVEYMRYRYGDDIGATDGCVAMRDAALPGAPVVWLTDMDHFGPAWNAFPALDRYDKTHMALALMSMALERTQDRSRTNISVAFDESLEQHGDAPEEDGESFREFLQELRKGHDGDSDLVEVPMAYPREKATRRRRRKRRGQSRAAQEADDASRDRLAKWLSGTEESEGEAATTLRKHMLKVPHFLQDRLGPPTDAVKRAKSVPSFLL